MSQEETTAAVPGYPHTQGQRESRGASCPPEGPNLQLRLFCSVLISMRSDRAILQAGVLTSICRRGAFAVNTARICADSVGRSSAWLPAWLEACVYLGDGLPALTYSFKVSLQLELTPFPPEEIRVLLLIYYYGLFLALPWDTGRPAGGAGSPSCSGRCPRGTQCNELGPCSSGP